MQGSSQDTLDRMEAMLRRCRRRIRMAEVSACLQEGLGLFLTCLLVIAGLFFVLRVVTHAVDVPTAVDWRHAVGIIAIVGIVVVGRALSLGIWGRPIHVAGAAERLDLAQSTHNRIATAIALLRSGDDSLFARAAIDDGYRHLERLQAERPHVESSPAPWRRMGTCLAVSVALVLAGQFLQAAGQSPGGGSLNAADPNLLARLDSDSPPVAPEIPTSPKQPPVERGGRQPDGDNPPRDDEPGGKDPSEREDPGKDSSSEGPTGQHASGKSRSSQSSSDSRSAATGAGAKSEPGKTEPGPIKKRRPGKKQTNGLPKVEQKNKTGGSINARGSSGAGSMRTAQNEWESEVKARSSDTDDFDLDEEPDEDRDKDKQRLGVQPALKSRTSQVSRELSLSMGRDINNDMMKGRGGPNAQKKSRGTATMIMGVPVPGFVQGRMLPGPTKSTQEEVEPSPREGAFAAASELRPARPEESPQESYRPSAAMGVRARDYLVKYHAEHESKRNGAATHE